MAKGLSISLRGALLEKVQAYAQQGGMSLQDAMRELAELGLSVAPADTVTLNARQRAYDDTRRFVGGIFAQKMTEFALDVEKTLGLEIFGSKPPRHG